MNEALLGFVQGVFLLLGAVIVFCGSALLAGVWVNAFRSVLKPTTSNTNVNWNPKVTLVPAEPGQEGKGPDAK